MATMAATPAALDAAPTAQARPGRARRPAVAPDQGFGPLLANADGEGRAGGSPRTRAELGEAETGPDAKVGRARRPARLVADPAEAMLALADPAPVLAPDAPAAPAGAGSTGARRAGPRTWGPGRSTPAMAGPVPPVAAGPGPLRIVSPSPDAAAGAIGAETGWVTRPAAPLAPLAPLADRPADDPASAPGAGPVAGSMADQGAFASLLPPHGPVRAGPAAPPGVAPVPSRPVDGPAAPAAADARGAPHGRSGGALAMGPAGASADRLAAPVAGTATRAVATPADGPRPALPRPATPTDLQPNAAPANAAPIMGAVPPNAAERTEAHGLPRSPAQDAPLAAALPPARPDTAAAAPGPASGAIPGPAALPWAQPAPAPSAAPATLADQPAAGLAEPAPAVPAELPTGIAAADHRPAAIPLGAVPAPAAAPAALPPAPLPGAPDVLPAPALAGIPALGPDLASLVEQLAADAPASAQLRLRPAELGTLLVRVEARGDALDARFLVETAAAHAAIERALPDLRAALAGHSLALGQATVGWVAVGGGGAGEAGRGWADGSAGRDPPGSPEPPAAAAAAGPSTRNHGPAPAARRKGRIDVLA